MISSNPSLSKFLALQEQSLRLQLDVVRSAISHRDEKGENLERHAIAFLRRLLPAEYGLGTGFIAHRAEDGSVKLSRQLDVVIYDALRGGPLIDLETVQVFPLEAVLAYVEVKSELYKRIPELVEQSARLRRLTKRTYACFLPDRALPHTTEAEGTQTEFESDDIGAREAFDAADAHHIFFKPRRGLFEVDPYLPIRGFVLAYEYGPTFDEAAMIDLFRKHHQSPAHFHAILVPEVCCVMSLNATGRPDLEGKVTVDTANPLARFRRRLIEDLATFPRMPANQAVPLDLYFEG